MNLHINPIKVLFLGLMLTFVMPAFADKDADESVTKLGTVNDDYYAAGGDVNIDAVVAGDVVVAGGNLNIGHDIKGDVIAAGGTIKIRGSIGDDVRAAGGEINIDANVGDDLIVSGGDLEISTRSTIDGDAWLAGGEVDMAGTVNKNLSIKAGRIQLSGIVHGDVDFEGGEIHINENARIDGDFNYRSSSKAVIHSSATISGNVNFEQADWDRPVTGSGIFMGVTLLIASLVLFLIFPRYTLAATEQLSTRPLQSVGLGFVILVLTPITAIVLMSIVLGLWVGLSLLALYFVIILVGLLIALFFVGDRGARLVNKEVSSTGLRILSVTVAIILLGLLQLIPVLGGLLIFGLLLAGMGAGFLQMRSDYRRPG